MFARTVSIFRAVAHPARTTACACSRISPQLRSFSAAVSQAAEDPVASSSGSALPSTPSSTLPSAPTPTPAEARPRPSEKDAGVRMRDVLRSVAQPVVIAVARTHGTCDATSAYHGATLTSFASLTLEPHPLVAFSLRLPSRMADLLRPCSSGPASPASPSPSPIQLTISLSAGVNQPIADALAKPGHDQGHIFSAPQWNNSDPPALVDAVGNLRCEVVHSVPLRECGGETASDAAGSELFICRVVDAERGTGKDSLVHYQRDYYSVSSHEHE